MAFNTVADRRARFLVSWMSTLVGGWGFVPAVLPAQQPAAVVTGTVRDSAGAPISGVEITLVSRTASTRSDTSGAFRLSGVQIGKNELQLRRFGYQPKTVFATVTAGTLAPIAVVLAVAAQELPAIQVDGVDSRVRDRLKDFFERRAAGHGYFITRQDIEDKNPSNLSQIMRYVPGAKLVSLHAGDRYQLRFARATMSHDCPPQYYIDGVMATGMNIDDMNPRDVEGIEIYAGPSRVPPQFNNGQMGTPGCGVVVIWTRVAGT